MEIVGVNWSEKIVIAIVNFVTWFIIHNNKKKIERERSEIHSSDDNVRDIFGLIYVRIILSLSFRCVYVCLGQVNQTNEKQIPNGKLLKRMKIWICNRTQKSMQMNRRTNETTPKIYSAKKKN